MQYEIHIMDISFDAHSLGDGELAVNDAHEIETKMGGNRR